MTLRSFLQGGLTPRRRGGRRAGEQHLPIDWHEPYLLFLSLTILLLSVADAFMTITLIIGGAREANPMLAFVLRNHPEWFASIKMTLTGSGVLMLVAIIGLAMLQRNATGSYSFDLQRLLELQLSPPTQTWFFLAFALAFAIKVLLDKWMDHIPLERQVRILERHGLVVTSQTLWDLAYAVTKRLSLVDAALFEHVKAQPVIGLDQTSWPRLEAEASKPWQMWCLTSPGVVVHRIRDDKSAATFKELVGDYNFDNSVDAADFVEWQQQEGQSGPGLSADGNDDGTVDDLDRIIRHNNDGNTLLLEDLLVA